MKYRRRLPDSIRSGTFLEGHSRNSRIAHDADRKALVYLPADYEKHPSARYPVLYLYHGANGSELDWVRYGRAGVILDNLIAGRRVVPMIVVMPNGQLVRPGGAILEVLARELLTDIVPAVERRYRVDAHRERRAIAGLSGGGAAAFIVGLKIEDWTLCYH